MKVCYAFGGPLRRRHFAFYSSSYYFLPTAKWKIPWCRLQRGKTTPTYGQQRALRTDHTVCMTTPHYRSRHANLWSSTKHGDFTSIASPHNSTRTPSGYQHIFSDSATSWFSKTKWGANTVEQRRKASLWSTASHDNATLWLLTQHDSSMLWSTPSYTYTKSHVIVMM